MLKRTLITLIVLLVLAGGLAQDSGALLNSLDTRLTVVETRLGLVESDLLGLRAVPVQLGRIEEKVTALAERSSGNSNVLQTVGLGIIMSLITGTISYAIGRKSQK